MQGGGVNEPVDIAVVGAGAAGLSLLVQLRAALAAAGDTAGALRPSIALVDPVHRRGADRTWCFWDGGRSLLDPVVHRAWRHVDLVARSGAARRLDLAPLRYAMVASPDFYAMADEAGDDLGVIRVQAPAVAIRDAPEAASVTAGGRTLLARWVFDSRPASPVRAARTAWVQHFRGWTVEFARSVVDPDVPVLMDFSVPQPDHGVAFGYVLPLDRRRALVEYTQLSRQRLESRAYDDALVQYLAQRYGRAARTARVLGIEDGAVPMTDAAYSRRAGGRVFRIGTAGGATRPSTGYTFSAMQRQAQAIAEALVRGHEPMPPRPYPPRHRWADAVMLRALDRGHTPGPELFCRLFDRNPPARVLRFLDGATTRREELRVLSSSPMPAMTRAALGDALTRGGRRLSGRAGGAAAQSARPVPRSVG